MGARRRLAWIPPFLVGFAAATCAELAGGLLLYSGPGFLRALTLLLGVELGALALGLWVAESGRPGDPMERARRRWLFCLVAFTAASGFAAAWQMIDGASAAFATRGLGLALLGGLPLYASGTVLGALDVVDRGNPDSHEAPAGTRTGTPVGAFAALGASAGVLTTGLVLLASLQPVSILLVCVVLVSAGALLHGWLHEAGEPSSTPTSTTTTTGSTAPPTAPLDREDSP